MPQPFTLRRSCLLATLVVTGLPAFWPWFTQPGAFHGTASGQEPAAKKLTIPAKEEAKVEGKLSPDDPNDRRASEKPVQGL